LAEAVTALTVPETCSRGAVEPCAAAIWAENPTEINVKASSVALMT